MIIINYGKTSLQRYFMEVEKKHVIRRKVGNVSWGQGPIQRYKQNSVMRKFYSS